MDQLARLKETFFGYLSPQRSAEPTRADPKRRRTVGPGTPVQSRAEEHAYEAVSEPRGEKAQAAFYRRITSKYTLRSDENSRKRGWEDDEEEEEEGVGLDEGEISVEEEQGDDGDDAAGDSSDEQESLSPDHSASQITPNEDEEGNEGGADGADSGERDDDEEYEEEVEQAHDPEAAARAKVEEYLARQAELALKKEAIEEVKLQGSWHSDEVYLFERLSLRSYEVLIPQEWQIDFPTLPQDIFDKDKDKVLINYNYGPSYHGVKALQPLLNLGLRVQGQPDYGTKYISKAIKDYIKWTEKDGGYFKKRFIPVLSVVTAKPNQPSNQITKQILDQMKFLARKYREILSLPESAMNELGEVELYKKQPPLLYGIVVAQTMAIFVTLDSSNAGAKLRHIAHFDFKEPKVHVWSGFALAIICIIARNYLMSVKDEFEDDDEPESDPDL